jgi:hypothetical protein
MSESSLGFEDLSRELDLWTGAGRVATLWWRDDDAIQPTEALAKLLDLSDSHAIEVAVAVIPAIASETLPDVLEAHSHTAILQHGYAHKNHARPGAKSVECGGDRPVEVVLGELAEGSRLLRELFGPRSEKILAVPWNRIERPVLEGLAEIGLRGASAYGPRAAMGGTGARIANAHVDPMNWRERRFAGLDKALSGFLGELRARRSGSTEAEEPLGLLTHHLDHDEPFWDFLNGLFRVTTAHPAARWITVREAFAAESSRQSSRVAST